MTNDSFSSSHLVSQQHPEYQYLNLLQNILDNGYDKELFLTPEVKAQYDAKSESYPTIRSLFGNMARYDLKQGFPLLTTKKVFFKAVKVELLWLLQGSGNIKYLVDNNVHIWDEWAWKKYIETMNLNGENDVLSFEGYVKKISEDDEFANKYGDLGQSYPVNWRHFKGHGDREADQIRWIIDGLKKRPFRKSYVVSAWHPAYTYEMAREGESMALPPCHTTFQFNVNDKNELSCALFQRSADMFLGVPFNIASYALLTAMIAQVCGFGLGEFVHFFGDSHVYSTHFDAVKEQLTREPKPFPKLWLNPEIKDIDDFKISDIKVLDYDSHPTLKADVANIGGF